MTHFVIRQKSTGLLFPTTGRSSRQAEFVDGRMPRLFHSAGAARRQLQYWLSRDSRPVSMIDRDAFEVVMVTLQFHELPALMEAS